MNTPTTEDKTLYLPRYYPAPRPGDEDPRDEKVFLLGCILLLFWVLWVQTT